MQNDTAQRILGVAHNLLMERGYSAFSYADIAEAMSIRKASIHHHFPTKTDLVVATLRRHRERLEMGTAHLDNAMATAGQRIRQYVSHWEACIRDRSQPFCIAALLAAELPSLPQEVQDEVKLHFEVLQCWLSATLKAGVKDGSIRLEQGADREAAALMATVHGAMMSARVTGSAGVYTSVMSDVVKRLLAA